MSYLINLLSFSMNLKSKVCIFSYWSNIIWFSLILIKCTFLGWNLHFLIFFDPNSGNLIQRLPYNHIILRQTINNSNSSRNNPNWDNSLAIGLRKISQLIEHSSAKWHPHDPPQRNGSKIDPNKFTVSTQHRKPRSSTHLKSNEKGLGITHLPTLCVIFA